MSKRLDAAIDALVDALAELPEHELEGWQRGNRVSVRVLYELNRRYPTATVTVASYLFSSSYVARTPHSGLKFMSPRERIPIGAVAIAVETRWGAYMIRSLCIFLVLSCVVGLTGLMTGNLWNRYAEENALPRSWRYLPTHCCDRSRLG